MSAALNLQSDNVPYFGSARSAEPAFIFDAAPDVQLTKILISAMTGLERALNAASLAGFELEPGFRRVSRRLTGVEESYVAELRVVRPARDAGFPRCTISPSLAVQGTAGD